MVRTLNDDISDPILKLKRKQNYLEPVSDPRLSGVHNFMLGPAAHGHEIRKKRVILRVNVKLIFFLFI